jgi:hypothetical protein
MLTIVQTEHQVSKLNINRENYIFFQNLLDLPYDLYEPIFTMLLSGVLTIEDFFSEESIYQNVTSNLSKYDTLDEKLKKALNVNSDSIADYIVSVIFNKAQFYGENYDHSSDNEYLTAFLPRQLRIINTDLPNIELNSIEKSRSIDEYKAKKELQYKTILSSLQDV